MTDARTVNPGQPVTYHGGTAPPAEPIDLSALRRALAAIPDAACVNPPRWLADLVNAAELVTGVRRETPAQRGAIERFAPGDPICPCGAPLLFSARERGNGFCGPCTRAAAAVPERP